MADNTDYPHFRGVVLTNARRRDTALRQRLSSPRRVLAGRGIAMPATTPGLSLDLQYGRIRDALLPLLLAQRGAFASHDPDGHLFVVRVAHKPAARGN